MDPSSAADPATEEFSRLLESVDPALAGWLVGLMAVVVILERLISFWRNHLREDPRPADTYATRADHLKLVSRVDRVETTIAAEIKELRAERSRSVADLHKRIEALHEKTNAELRDETRRLHTRTTEILESLAALKGQVAAQFNRRQP